MICVYAIRNVINGEVYIGASNHVKRRWKHHRQTLRKGTSDHTKLKKAWTLYGPHCFEFIVLEECEEGDLRRKEQKWLDKSPQYNLSLDATRTFFGLHHTEEAKKRTGDARRGIPRSDEVKKKLSEWRKGRRPPLASEELRLKRSISKKEYWARWRAQHELR